MVYVYNMKTGREKKVWLVAVRETGTLGGGGGGGGGGIG